MSNSMQSWALTGPTGAGKSAVSEILRRQGAAVVDGDCLGHQLLATPAIQERIIREIGPQYVSDQVVDRSALGELVFGDAGARAVLNDITHGPLGALASLDMRKIREAGDHRLAVFEAAVYFLLPNPPAVDLVIAASALSMPATAPTQSSATRSEL